MRVYRTLLAEISDPVLASIRVRVKRRFMVKVGLGLRAWVKG